MGWGGERGRVNFGLKFSFNNPSYQKKETDRRKQTTLTNFKAVLLIFLPSQAQVGMSLFAFFFSLHSPKAFIIKPPKLCTCLRAWE